MYNNYQNQMYQQYPQNQFGYNGYNSYQQPQQYQQQYNYNDMLSGKIVDSIEVVKAINADLSGKSNYYPKSDGSEIYSKRINPQTGASVIQTYVLKDDGVGSQSEQSCSLYDITKQIGELKDLILDNITKPSNGGGK